MALTRKMDDKLIAGVCSGLGEYLGLESAVVRLCFVLAFLLWGAGPIIYLILWLIMKPDTK
jgi:phage shock protein PspC (stress-responsive transcriptional regulator)